MVISAHKHTIRPIIYYNTTKLKAQDNFFDRFFAVELKKDISSFKC